MSGKVAGREKRWGVKVDPITAGERAKKKIAFLILC